ncbi:class II aldolase/adducin family protein [Porphyromonadaceae bacterium]
MKQMDVNLMHPAEQITLIIGRIYRSGMTTTSGGNISIKDEEENIWITPGSIDKGSLTAKDIVCVTKEGKIIGAHKPSSEYPFHKSMFDMRPDQKAIIHAHPPALVAFSIAHQVPNTNIIPQSKSRCGTVGFAPYGLPGSWDLGEKIAAVFKKNPAYKAVIMENHGVVLYGNDLMDAYRRFETLEFCARTLINANILGGAKFLTDEQIAVHEQAVSKNVSHFFGATHPSDERAIRSEIVKTVRRACDQGLMISSYGTVSVRWKNNDFLITPPSVHRWNIDAEDIVQVKGGLVEAGKTPSRSVALHAEIYQRNPHINSIILTQPPHLMGFATSGSRFDVRTIPESWILLKDAPILPFGSQYTNSKELAEMFAHTPCLMLANDSVVVTGDKLIQTFDRLEVAEFSAKALIMTHSLGGTLHPISDKEVEELRIAFKVK